MQASYQHDSGSRACWANTARRHSHRSHQREHGHSSCNVCSHKRWSASPEIIYLFLNRKDLNRAATLNGGRYFTFNALMLCHNIRLSSFKSHCRVQIEADNAQQHDRGEAGGYGCVRGGADKRPSRQDGDGQRFSFGNAGEHSALYLLSSTSGPVCADEVSWLSGGASLQLLFREDLKQAMPEMWQGRQRTWGKLGLPSCSCISETSFPQTKIISWYFYWYKVKVTFFLQENGEGKVLDQFSNQSNPLAHYKGTGPELWEQTNGNITHFVSSMGTTG